MVEDITLSFPTFLFTQREPDYDQDTDLHQWVVHSSQTGRTRRETRAGPIEASCTGTIGSNGIGNNVIKLAPIRNNQASAVVQR